MKKTMKILAITKIVIALMVTVALVTLASCEDNASGGDGTDYVGGLVGVQFNGSIITASCATGDVDGDGNRDRSGGLIGRQAYGSITASYATSALVGRL